MKSNLKGVTSLAVLLLSAQVLLVLMSWLLSAMMTEGVRSLISSEGVRWFLGGFVDIMLTPLLAWMLLLAMAYGCIRRAARHPHLRPRRRLWAWLSVFAVVLTSVLLVGLLAATPHAILLSATGQLFPSAFSRALVPLLALTIILSAVAYGLSARSFHSLSNIVSSMIFGLEEVSPWLFLYLLSMQLYESVLYVFF